MAATHATIEQRRAQVQLAHAALRERTAGRIEDYQELRSWGLTRAQAAARMGVCYKTAQRYEARLRGSA